MKVSSVHLRNIKSVKDSGPIALSPGMNVLLGRNNAGKSILTRCLYALQELSSLIPPQDIRVEEETGTADIHLVDAEGPLQLLGVPAGVREATFSVVMHRTASQIARNLQHDRGTHGNVSFAREEPNNAVYPFLAKRKVSGYDETVNLARTVGVTGDFRYLVAKVYRLANSLHPLHGEFAKACDDILGFQIGTVASPGGHKVGFPVGNMSDITLEAMGEGVPHLLALITDLCIAKDKLFLLEEPEDDMHPDALKSLLNLIIKKSEWNQFVVTTHSNIVARYLGSIPGSTTYRVTMHLDGQLPVTQYTEIGPDPEERRSVLQELGYEMTDYDLWDGWLILEESSAERVIIKFLIPWFTPMLANRLRSIAAPGIDGVEAKFNDLNRLFLFTHLTPCYHNRVWVLVDAGQRGDAIVRKLQADYAASGWQADRFRTFSQTNFERYYPARFQDDATAALALTNRTEKRAAKKALLDRVLAWIEQEPGVAEQEFEGSAQEVIAILREIEAALEY